MLLSWSPRSPIWLFSLIATLSPLCSALFNVTVDDNSPTITYIPTGDWSFGPTCSNCIAKPDPTQAFDGTWHDELFIPADDMTQTVTLSFKGSAIYAFCVLAPTSDSLDGSTDMTFFIDGQNVGSFTRDTAGQSGYQYNVPVYANPSLPFGDHTFTLQNGRTGGQAALALFDYMIYTTEDESQVTTSAQSSASIQSSAADSQSTPSTQSTPPTPFTPPTRSTAASSAQPPTSSEVVSSSGTSTAATTNRESAAGSSTSTKSTPSNQSNPPTQSNTSTQQTTAAGEATNSLDSQTSASPSASSEPAAGSSTNASTSTTKHTFIIPVVSVAAVIIILIVGLVVYLRVRKAKTATYDGADSHGDVNPYHVSFGRDTEAYPRGAGSTETNSTAEDTTESRSTTRDTGHAGAPPLSDISEEKDTATDVEEVSRAPPPYYQAEA